MTVAAQTANGLAARDLHDAFLGGLARIVGERNVIAGPSGMDGFLVDWRRRYRGDALCVVQPRTTEEVSAVVKACAAACVSIVPQGGNTGMCGGATPVPGGRSVVLSLSRMNRIREVNAADNTLTADAGCVLQTIQEAASAADRLFPMSLGSEGSCQIGGNVATNAGGTAVLRYGTMRDLVLGIEAVLPDGRVWNGLSRLRKDNTGFDLRHLLIGAEGTLGVITGVVLKLFPKPKAAATALVAVPSASAALALLGSLRAACGERINAFELMSESQFSLVLSHRPTLTNPLGSLSPWFVFLELTDTLDQLDLAAVLEAALETALESGMATNAVVARSLGQAAQIWRIRHSVTEANLGAGAAVSHDTSVPVSAVPVFVEDVDREIRARFPDARTFHVGHVGDGNIHVIAIFPRPAYSDPARFAETAAAVNELVDDIATSLGGSISAEHGIGQSNRQRLLNRKDPLAIEFMRKMKRLLDPLGIMNPGTMI